MLKRDHELRLSAEVQARYAACGDSSEAKEKVTQTVQLQVSREAGFSGRSTRDGVDLLQSALSLFPDDPELISAAFYLKHNIHVPCPIPIGSTVPPIKLHHADLTTSPTTKTVTLQALVANAPLTVLCAGSLT
mmetsp:Transcript_33775/g.55759  ORF Transcript_33775/g.55759 Transcript_33775/m.55759 type:complete len:133 (+) Transcript_33775:340-738(+)